MHASIAECKRRTLQYIALPTEEKFTLELVTKQPWSGYNWYKGNATSLIQINTDLPVLMSRVVAAMMARSAGDEFDPVWELPVQ